MNVTIEKENRQLYFPREIIFEVTSLCNLRCKGCAFHGPKSFTKRPKGHMDMAVWEKCVNEIASWGREVHLILHGAGEPLLQPKFKQFLRLLRSHDLLRAGFLSNGMLFDEDWSKFVIDNNLEWVGFSIDGVHPATHRQVRPGSDLQQIEKNLNRLLEMREKARRSRPRVTLNMVMYPEIASQKDAFFKKWFSVVDSITFSYFRDPPSSKRWPRTPLKRSPCPLLWSQMVIAWDGTVGLCCEDFDMDESLGNVRQQSILEIWNGSRISMVRNAHKDGKIDGLALCRTCDTWAFNVTLVESRDNKLGYVRRKKVAQEEFCHF